MNNKAQTQTRTQTRTTVNAGRLVLTFPPAARPIRYAGRAVRVTHRERALAAQWVRGWRKVFARTGSRLSLEQARQMLFVRFA